MTKWRVPLVDLDFGPEEHNAARKVIESRWLTMGEMTERFERAFADYIGVGHAIAVSNATVALHLANLALGIGPGDEVIVPSLTFVATANAVRYVGATPIFADVASAEDLCVSPDSIRAQITPRTKAITAMHFGGYLCDMPAIRVLAEEHGLDVIEDAAHAPGAELDGRKAGNWGDVGCFSFFSNKNLVTGEGGMIVTNRDDLAQNIRLMRSHGMTSINWDRHEDYAYSYDVVALGFNYRIDEIRSTLGIAQLEKLEGNNVRRRTVTERYCAGLENLDGVSIPFLLHRGVSAAHLMPILLAPGVNRKGFIDAMHDQGVQTSIHYPPVHGFTYYRQGTKVPFLPVTEDVASRELTLPLYPTMGNESLELVVAAVENSLNRVAN